MKTEYDKFDEETAALFREYDESDWGWWETDPRWNAVPISARFWYVRKRMGWIWKAALLMPVGGFAILVLFVLLLKANELAEVEQLYAQADEEAAAGVIRQAHADMRQPAATTIDTPTISSDEIATTDTRDLTEKTVDTTSSKSNDDVDLQLLESSQIDDDSVKFGLDACKNHIRANARDPNSVRWREVVYIGESGNIHVYMITVQWTNGFGGPAVQDLTCGYGTENGLLVVNEL